MRLFLRGPRAAGLIAVAFAFAGLVAVDGQQPFVGGSDISFKIATDGKVHEIGDEILIHYTIRNISNGALYVPRAQWEIKCGVNPHLWGRLEDRSGQHYESGFAASCLGPNPVDRMSLAERMRKDAVLLKPGQAVRGSFSFDSSVFAARLKPGAYRLEAVLYGWNQRYDNLELEELSTMGAPFLSGESNAWVALELRRR